MVGDRLLSGRALGSDGMAPPKACCVSASGAIFLPSKQLKRDDDEKKFSALWHYSAASGIAAAAGSSAGAKLSARAIAQACASRSLPPPDSSAPGFGNR